MTSKAETVNSQLDITKQAVALFMVIAAVVAFYIFADRSLLLRVIGLLVIVGGAIGLIFSTAKGHQLAEFIKGSQLEVRKVVWPTRQETVQTTLLVLFFVVIVALFLWFLEWILSGIVHNLTGQV